MDNQNIEYKLPQDAYVNFDALSLKEFMIEQLNKGGKFTDQNYEGSNLAAILDILAYYTHVLLFYLNQTSSETMFSQANIYENMNKIVSLIGYKPTGKQTSICSIDCVAESSLTPNSYLLRKYSYFLVNNIQYTIIDNFPFEKTTSEREEIVSVNNNLILYQGTVNEYPEYIAEGVEFETFPIVVENLVNDNDTKFISNNTISVYVKEKMTDIWYEYTQVDTLFLTNSTDRVFDLRLNENGHYEVKFGNGVFGKKLDSDDVVSVFYILSDGDRGKISKNSINGNKLFLYNNLRFNQIFEDVYSSEFSSNILDQSFSSSVIFSNPIASTSIQNEETVDQIRENTPVFLSSQLRLVTEIDYEKFLRKTIPNIVSDLKIMDNTDFMSEYIQYFYDMCVDPNKVNRVILNQVNYADSCDFNNVNIFCVPIFDILEDEQYPDFLSNSYKSLIRDITNDKKIIGHEIVPRDPVYIAMDIGYTTNKVSKDIYLNSKLVLTRKKNSKRNREHIKGKVLNLILDYFNSKKTKLGQTIDLSYLTTQILNMEDVKSLKTVNTDGSQINGLSFISWNPVFEGMDDKLIAQTTTLQSFKFPYIYRPKSLINRIEVVDDE